ncbi:unnamed protein product [Closterium sp. NIES-54]
MSSAVTHIYLHVIQDVIKNVRPDFQSDGVDESVLQELQQVRPSSLQQVRPSPLHQLRPSPLHQLRPSLLFPSLTGRPFSAPIPDTLFGATAACPPLTVLYLPMALFPAFSTARFPATNLSVTAPLRNHHNLSLRSSPLFPSPPFSSPLSSPRSPRYSGQLWEAKVMQSGAVIPVGGYALPPPAPPSAEADVAAVVAEEGPLGGAEGEAAAEEGVGEEEGGEGAGHGGGFAGHDLNMPYNGDGGEAEDEQALSLGASHASVRPKLPGTSIKTLLNLQVFKGSCTPFPTALLCDSFRSSHSVPAVRAPSLPCSPAAPQYSSGHVTSSLDGRPLPFMPRQEAWEQKPFMVDMNAGQCRCPAASLPRCPANMLLCCRAVLLPCPPVRPLTASTNPACLGNQPRRTSAALCV